MSLVYSPEDQKKMEAKIEAGVSASTAEASAILREIHQVAFELNEPDWRRQARIMAMFATLTVLLSIKADRIQRWMVTLTVLIAIMTFILLWTVIFPNQPLPSSQITPQTNQANPNTNQTQTQKP